MGKASALTIEIDTYSIRRCAKKKFLAERASNCQNAGAAIDPAVIARLTIGRAPAGPAVEPKSFARSLRFLSRRQRQRGQRNDRRQQLGLDVE